MVDGDSSSATDTTETATAALAQLKKDWDWPEWLYLTCGIAGAVVIVLLAVIVYLCLRLKKQNRKLKGVVQVTVEAGGHDNPQYYDDDGLNDGVFGGGLQQKPVQMPVAAGPLTAYQEERTVIQQTEYPGDLDNGPVVTTVVNTSSQVRSQPDDRHIKDEYISYDDGRNLAKRGQQAQEKRQHRRSRDVSSRHDQDGPPGLGRLRPDEGWALEQEDEKRRHYGRPAGNSRHNDNYSQEMDQYRPHHSSRQHRAGGPDRFDEDETASAIIPRAQVLSKPSKKTSSIPDMGVIRETRETRETERKDQRRPKAAETGWSYTNNKVSGLDKDFAVSRDFDDHRRPVTTTLSQEEFGKRKRVIEEQATRPRRDQSPRDSRRAPSYDDGFSRDGAGEQGRRANRHSTSVSPNPYQQQRN